MNGWAITINQIDPEIQFANTGEAFCLDCGLDWEPGHVCPAMPVHVPFCGVCKCYHSGDCYASSDLVTVRSDK